METANNEPIQVGVKYLVVKTVHMPDTYRARDGSETRARYRWDYIRDPEGNTGRHEKVENMLVRQGEDRQFLFEMRIDSSYGLKEALNTSFLAAATNTSKKASRTGLKLKLLEELSGEECETTLDITATGTLERK